jgi:uncharacterized protein (DUF1810 family)
VSDSFDLQRFVDAQASIYRQVVEELSRGRKQTHWMWFIFPQIAGLGRSATAQAYAIGDLAEAQAYLAHPVLGPRLLECAQIVASHQGLTAQQIFGSIDAMKLRSSMTLFAHADPEQQVFGQVIDQYFAGPDPETEQRL